MFLNYAQIFFLSLYPNFSYNVIYYYSNVIFYVWQSMLALKPDGLFLAAILGGETLR